MCENGFEAFLEDELKNYQTIAEELPKIMVSMSSFVKLLNHSLTQAVLIIQEEVPEFKEFSLDEIKKTLLEQSAKDLLVSKVADKVMSEMFNNFKNN